MLRKIFSSKVLLRRFSQVENIRSIEKELPSPDFLSKYIRKPSQKLLFSKIVLELQTFLRILGSSSLPEITDDVWTSLVSLPSFEQRTQFLIMLKQNHSEQQDRIKDELEKPEIGSSSNIYYSEGKEFRKRIDQYHSNSVLRLKRNEEDLPQLLVDCRFLNDFSLTTQTVFMTQIQKLYEANWTSRHPFNITIMNYTPDQQLSTVAQRNLYFKYGPPSKDKNAKFEPHMFAPKITSQSVKNVLPCDKSEAIYISWKARDVLPSKPLNCKAVILCTSLDAQPCTSSYSLAIMEGIKSYRIPLEKHVLLKGSHRVLPLAQTSMVLRSYFLGDDLGQAIKDSFLHVKLSKRSRAKESEALIESYRSIVEKLELEKNREQKKIEFLNSPSKIGSYKPTARSYNHRYSREERKNKKQ
ncbi:unnamed protein product [Auanema sp. JU1783]|nr:unnamed protein product [Auanema sp. JU1783]